MKSETHFKGWAKPGIIPPGLAAGVSVEPHETLDAISGHFRLFQLRAGHRFSTDDILTAWYGTSWCPTARTALDLGSGLGTVGMICAWRLAGAKFVTVEAQSESVALAQKSARYNGLTERYEIRAGDFRDAGVLRAGKSSTSSPAARRIFRRARASKASIRRSWRAALNCAAPLPIIARRRRTISRPAAFSRACFRTSPRSLRAWRRARGRPDWSLCVNGRWFSAKAIRRWSACSA